MKIFYQSLLAISVVTSTGLLTHGAEAQPRVDEVVAFARQNSQVGARMGDEDAVGRAAVRLATGLSPLSKVNTDNRRTVIQVEDLDIATQIALPPLGDTEAIRTATHIVDRQVFPQLPSVTGEKLEFVRIERERVGAAPVANPGATVSHVVATHVLFRRTLNGVPIVSDPAAVRIVLTNERKLARVALHWLPLTVAAGTRARVTSESIRREIAQKLAVHKQDRPNAQATLGDVECGLLDPEISAPVGGNLVTGCRFHALISTRDTTTTLTTGVRDVAGTTAVALPPAPNNKADATN